MARYEFRLPDIGEGIAQAEITAWHVKIGDRVDEDGRLADVMTDKATVEMESPVAGKVLELAGEVGDQISIGSVLVVIDTDQQAAEAKAEDGGSVASAKGAARSASPLAPARKTWPIAPQASSLGPSSPIVTGRARLASSRVSGTSSRGAPAIELLGNCSSTSLLSEQAPSSRKRTRKARMAQGDRPSPPVAEDAMFRFSFLGAFPICSA